MASFAPFPRVIVDFSVSDKTGSETTDPVHTPGGFLYGSLTLVVNTLSVPAGHNLKVYVQTAEETDKFCDVRNYFFENVHSATPSSPIVIRDVVVPPSQSISTTGIPDGTLANSSINTAVLPGAFWRVKTVASGSPTYNYKVVWSPKCTG